MTRHIQKVLICAGARDGVNPLYKQAAAEMGALLGKNGYDIVYGGGNVGLMGAGAAAAQAHGSKVTGYLASAFAAAGRELPNCAKMETLETLFLRKERMVLDSDAGIILPGGIGTLDELLELAADNDIARYIDKGVRVKPIVVLNLNGYFDGMAMQMDRCVAEGFMNAEQTRMVHFVTTVDQAIAVLNSQNVEPIYGRDLFPGQRP